MLRWLVSFIQQTNPINKITLTKTNIDFNKLIKYLNYSQLAYKDSSDKVVEGFTHFYDAREHSKQDTQAYMWYDEKDDIIIVAFRGTSSVADILADIYIHINVKHIHDGFWKQFEAIENKLTHDISELLKPNTKIVFCGHSLAGALATISGHYYGGKWSNTDISVFTYGSPRVGSAIFCQEYEQRVKQSYRVFHENDIVPQVPFFAPYFHVGKGIQIALNTCYLVENDMPSFQHMMNLHSVASHYCENYKNCLQSLE